MIAQAPTMPIVFQNQLTRLEGEVAEIIYDFTEIAVNNKTDKFPSMAAVSVELPIHGIQKYGKAIFAQRRSVSDAVSRLIEVGLVEKVKLSDFGKKGVRYAWAYDVDAELTTSVEPGGYDESWKKWKDQGERKRR